MYHLFAFHKFTSYPEFIEVNTPGQTAGVKHSSIYAWILCFIDQSPDLLPCQIIDFQAYPVG